MPSVIKRQSLPDFFVTFKLSFFPDQLGLPIFHPLNRYGYDNVSTVVHFPGIITDVLRLIHKVPLAFGSIRKLQYYSR